MTDRFEGLDAALAAKDKRSSRAKKAPRKRSVASGGALTLDNRDTLIEAAGSQNRKTVSQLYVRPEQCRMWSRHNRIYDLLTPENCSDLIDLIKADGKQKTPAIARRLTDDPDGFEYEIIAGARRHFSVSHLRAQDGFEDLLYLIEVRKISDEEAFVVSDAENRGRKDISDYERARDYAFALSEYYDGNQSAMSSKIGINRSTLRHFLNLAALPKQIVSAFALPTDIALRNASKLTNLLGDNDKSAKIMEEASLIAEEQAEAKKLGSVGVYDGAAVTKRLVETAAVKKKRGVKRDVTKVTDASGRSLFTVERGRKYITVQFEKAEMDNVSDLLERLREELSSAA